MKIIVADDHPMVRAGLIQILSGLEIDIDFVEAADYAETRDAVMANPEADLALVDLYMPGMRGATSVGELVSLSPSVPLVVVSASDTPRDIRACLTAGAAGFIPKNEKPSVLFGALRLVIEGGIYAPASLAGADPAEFFPRPNLTPRQQDVLALVVEGRSNKEIARHVGLAEQTVKGHLLALFKALNVRNRVQAVQAARKFGFVGSEL